MAPGQQYSGHHQDGGDREPRDGCHCVKSSPAHLDHSFVTCRFNFLSPLASRLGPDWGRAQRPDDAGPLVLFTITQLDLNRGSTPSVSLPDTRRRQSGDPTMKRTVLVSLSAAGFWLAAAGVPGVPAHATTHASATPIKVNTRN